MNRLKIGTVTALLTPDDIRITPDDRQELIKAVEHTGGTFAPTVVVYDGGYCSKGEVTVVSGAKFTSNDFATIRGYWENRTLVSFTNLEGTQLDNRRIRITQWTENKRFPIITCDLEVWQI